jgi:hypothetical protein
VEGPDRILLFTPQVPQLIYHVPRASLGSGRIPFEDLHVKAILEMDSRSKFQVAWPFKLAIKDVIMSLYG